MNTEKKEIIFLNRAYNDLDIQLSLIREFAADKNYNVRVIGYPCDGGVGSPAYHEGARYMSDKYGVSFETVLDKAPAPLWLRIMQKIERKLFDIKSSKLGQNKTLGLPIKAAHVTVLKIMRKALSGILPWLDQVAEKWNPEIIIADEALVQTGRSHMIDHVLQKKIKQGTKVHVIQTGQTTYFDANPNKTSPPTEKVQQKTKSSVLNFFVPSELDKSAVNTNYPLEEPRVHGNLRMDKGWIKRLHEEILVPPYMNKQAYMDKLPKGKGPKVVFMLSKLGYGIKVDELKDTIKLVADMKGVSCAIKPHTRGMKFDFMDPASLEDVIIVPDIPSTLLIEWADILLFTGSSIAFHALILGKRAGYLQNCQYIKTTFDDGVSCDKFDTLDELETFLAKWRDDGTAPEVPEDVIMARKKWQADNIHGGLEDGLTAKHYKKLILKD